jgi:hypothetical protein
LKEVAGQSGSLADFGRNLRDWLHEVRRLSSRPQLERAIAEELPRLKGRFPGGKTADAWLAAYAEHVSSRINRMPPRWAFRASRVAEEPWFADESAGPRLRALALIRSPLAFKRRNLYTPDVELPVNLRPGRPRKTEEQKRESNAELQRRFRARRRAELRYLLGGLRKSARSRSLHAVRDAYR